MEKRIPNLTTMEYVMLRLLELDGIVRTEKATEFQIPLLRSLVEKGFALSCPDGWRKLGMPDSEKED